MFSRIFSAIQCIFYCISSQCDNKASEDSTTVHVLALEGGSGTEVSSQHLVPDSAVPMAPGECNMYVCFHKYTVIL